LTPGGRWRRTLADDAEPGEKIGHDVTGVALEMNLKVDEKFNLIERF
jgi:hypothetical protein